MNVCRVCYELPLKPLWMGKSIAFFNFEKKTRPLKPSMDGEILLAPFNLPQKAYHHGLSFTFQTVSSWTRITFAFTFQLKVPYQFHHRLISPRR